MQLTEAYAALTAGTHVLVRHTSEAGDDQIAVVPKVEFDRWKESIKEAVKHGEWPDEITASTEIFLGGYCLLQIDRWINTTGDSWGCGDGPEEYGRDI